MKAGRCPYCANLGWSKEFWLRYGWRIGGHDALFGNKKRLLQVDVYKCPRCEKPKDAEEMPKGMLPQHQEDATD